MGAKPSLLQFTKFSALLIGQTMPGMDIFHLFKDVKPVSFKVYPLDIELSEQSDFQYLMFALKYKLQNKELYLRFLDILYNEQNVSIEFKLSEYPAVKNILPEQSNIRDRQTDTHTNIYILYRPKLKIINYKIGKSTKEFSYSCFIMCIIDYKCLSQVKHHLRAKMIEFSKRGERPEVRAFVQNRTQRYQASIFIL